MDLQLLFAVMFGWLFLFGIIGVWRFWRWLDTQPAPEPEHKAPRIEDCVPLMSSVVPAVAVPKPKPKWAMKWAEEAADVPEPNRLQRRRHAAQY